MNNASLIQFFSKAYHQSYTMIFIMAVLLLDGCIPRPSFPTGVFPDDRPRVPEPDAAAAKVPEGYQVEVFMKDLVWPSSIEFDEEGNVYVAEAGYAYGDPFSPAQVFRISSAGEITILSDAFKGPITDLLWYQGRLYVSHLGKISAVDRNGNVSDLVTDLPSSGDHQNNQMSVGPDGKIYFGQGTATNSGVVGMDNVYPFVWLMLYPHVHDVPAQDIRLRGESFLTPHPNNVLARQGRLLSFSSNVGYALASTVNRNPKKSLLVSTRAFHPFGEKGSRTVKGQVKSSGSVLRMNPDGSQLEVYAWGLRNPFGVMWSPNGQLYVSNNGYDERGSRPVANAKDDLLKIQKGGWYGFPDYSSGIPVTDKQFRSNRGPRLEFLLAEHPTLAPIWMTRPEHAGVAKFDFSTHASFGFPGQLFLAEVGSGAPITGDDQQPSGHIVVRVDTTTSQAYPFFQNNALGPKGMEYVSTRGPRRPVEVKFSPDGQTMYIVDIGVFHGALAGPGPFPLPVPGTGVIWRVTKRGATTSGPPANLSYMPPKVKPNR